MANSQNSKHGQPEHNKPANTGTTRKNEPQRTPESRNDRESHIGGSNQTHARKGGPAGNRH
ncbi:MAG: hypothetical protein JWP29_4823 [Rhodoferax sp.]|nr:hypothetical protein [Rhodoferax sp.]